MTAPTTPPPGPAAGPPRTLTARSPGDVLALVPVVLGFVPHDSVAMLTFGAAHPFHARVDLPDGPAGLPELVDALLVPARHHRVRRVFFVIYTDSSWLARLAARRLESDFRRAGIEVADSLRADGRRWWPARGSRPGVPSRGVPYDLSSHRFSAQAVLDGRVLHGSREELRRTLAADPDAVGQVVAALAGRSGSPASPDPDWAAGLVTRCRSSGGVATDHEVADLLRGLLEVEVRDAACRDLGRATARAHVAFWADVVRRCPDPLLAAPASLLALAAWQAGEGALAWCALDRCADVDDAYPLAQLVGRALAEALPPDTWEPTG